VAPAKGFLRGAPRPGNKKAVVACCATAFKSLLYPVLHAFKSRGALRARKVIKAKIVVPAPARLHEIEFLDSFDIKILLLSLSRKFSLDIIYGNEES
jgi:hypothetical protein